MTNLTILPYFKLYFDRWTTGRLQLRSGSYKTLCVRSENVTNYSSQVAYLPDKEINKHLKGDKLITLVVAIRKSFSGD